MSTPSPWVQFADKRKSPWYRRLVRSIGAILPSRFDEQSSRDPLFDVPYPEPTRMTSHFYYRHWQSVLAMRSPHQQFWRTL